MFTLILICPAYSLLKSLIKPFKVEESGSPPTAQSFNSTLSNNTVLLSSSSSLSSTRSTVGVSSPGISVFGPQEASIAKAALVRTNNELIFLSFIFSSLL